MYIYIYMYTHIICISLSLSLYIYIYIHTYVLQTGAIRPIIISCFRETVKVFQVRPILATLGGVRGETPNLKVGSKLETRPAFET